MNYFEKKAEEINNKIHEARISNKNITIEEIEKIIEIGLKEVAKDQRYKAIENMLNYGTESDSDVSLECSIIQNSNLD